MCTVLCVNGRKTRKVKTSTTLLEFREVLAFFLTGPKIDHMRSLSFDKKISDRLSQQDMQLNLFSHCPSEQKAVVH